VEIFDVSDVVALLRREVDMAGGQSAWSKITGNSRTLLNQVLSGRRTPSARMIAALNLRMVFVRGNESPQNRLRLRPRAQIGDPTF
jgi:hypothetical protein